MKFQFDVYKRLGGVLIASGVLLVGCGSAPPSATNPEPSTAWGLHPTNEAQLTSYFKQAMGLTGTSYLNTVWAVDFAAAATAAAPTATTSTPVFSGTTLQESGVDEADLIKSDGNFVFSLDPEATQGLVRNTLRRQQLNGTATDAHLIAADSLKLPFSTYVSGSGFYLDSAHQQLIAVGERNIGWGIYDTWFAPQSWGSGLTELAFIDVSSLNQMQIRRTLQMTGQLIGSRRIGATLYLVLRSYPQIPGLDPSWPTSKIAANQALINSLQAAQLLPTLSVDGGTAQPLVLASSCYTQDQNSVKSADIITIVGIDLASSTEHHSANCFTGGTEAFYMSDQSLYLATTRTAYTYNGLFPAYSRQSTTDIHKFALNGLDINYRGSGNVIGHLGFVQNRKSFRMGEYAGALRVITQTSPTWTSWIALPMTSAPASGVTPSIPIDSPAHLTILNENAGALQTLSELPNAARPEPLGKAGEQLYASRFLGARGYIVTYRLTDPLYVLDLANPADPKIAGELRVDGYSEYLFPLSPTILLGVGKDAVSDGTSGDGRFAWYQGVKVSLIDVTDPANPHESVRQIIGKRGTDATVLHDSHGIALQNDGNSVRISLPVSLHDTPSPYYSTGTPAEYFDFTRTELQRFDIDLSAQTLSANSALVSGDSGQRDISNDRALLWNNQVHWYQNGNWMSAVW